MIRRQISATRQPPPDWSFTVSEVSNGVYRATGVGPDGVIVQRHGTDDASVLNRVIEDAEKLSA